jgi:hypothetical protein
MDRHEPRDLDGVIDDVARGMTSTRLMRDPRPAVAARMAGAASWTPGWLAACGSAAAAAAVVAAVLMRPGPEEKRPAVANTGEVRATAPASRAQAMAAVVEDVAVAVPKARRVARQLVDDAPVVEQVVEIDPLAIVPLEDGDATEYAPLSQRVEIAPIDVELVSISQLDQVE